MYSVKKKARRLQQNFTQLAGLRSAVSISSAGVHVFYRPHPQTVDPMFDEREHAVLAMESCLRSLQRNTTSWKEETEVSGCC